MKHPLIKLTEYLNGISGNIRIWSGQDSASIVPFPFHRYRSLRLNVRRKTPLPRYFAAKTTRSFWGLCCVCYRIRIYKKTPLLLFIQLPDRLSYNGKEAFYTQITRRKKHKRERKRKGEKRKKRGKSKTGKRERTKKKARKKEKESGKAGKRKNRERNEKEEKGGGVKREREKERKKDRKKEKGNRKEKKKKKSGERNGIEEKGRRAKREREKERKKDRKNISSPQPRALCRFFPVQKKTGRVLMPRPV